MRPSPSPSPSRTRAAINTNFNINSIRRHEKSSVYRRRRTRMRGRGYSVIASDDVDVIASCSSSVHRPSSEFSSRRVLGWAITRPPRAPHLSQRAACNVHVAKSIPSHASASSASLRRKSNRYIQPHRYRYRALRRIPMPSNIRSTPSTPRSRAPDTQTPAAQLGRTTQLPGPLLARLATSPLLHTASPSDA